MKKFFALAALAMLCAAPTMAKGVKAKAPKQSQEVTDVQCRYQGCTGYVFICGDGVRIRTAPSLNSQIIGKENWYFRYKNWRSFPCLDIVNGFYKIRYKGRVAYVSCQYATHQCPD